MAFDGIMTAALRDEFSRLLTGARVSKIQQPEDTALLFQFKTQEGTVRLLLSANASLPYAAVVSENRTGPEEAPAFLMLLRKHLGGARLLSVEQPRFDRVLLFRFEHLNELGDPEEKQLILELMGRHSNLIFTESDGRILDAIRRVPPTMSSVRTVLPGKYYEPADVRLKEDPRGLDRAAFLSGMDGKRTLADGIFSRFSGFSSSASSELLFGSGLDPDRYISSLSSSEAVRYADVFLAYMEKIEHAEFSPCLALGPHGEAEEFSAMPLKSYSAAGKEVRPFASPSALVVYALGERASRVLMRQRGSSLKAVAETNLKRAVRKRELLEKQLADTDGREKDRLYGELLTAYQYQLSAGASSVTVLNYYTDTEITIPVDKDLTISENAQRYYNRYAKARRTREATEKLLPETVSECEHLESILSEIALAEDEQTLAGIRREMAAAGYLHSGNGKAKKERSVSKPYHYVSSDGFDLYVGKNNLQNDELSLRFAGKKDLFFHVKKAAGSHVILKTDGKEVPDRAYQEAASLAVYYSSLRESGRGEVDYVEAGRLKKPAGARPGYVIYHTNYSMVAEADLSGLTKLS